MESKNIVAKGRKAHDFPDSAKIPLAIFPLIVYSI